MDTSTLQIIVFGSIVLAVSLGVALWNARDVEGTKDKGGSQQ